MLPASFGPGAAPIDDSGPFAGLARIPLAGGPRELLRNAGAFELDDASVYYLANDGVYCFAK